MISEPIGASLRALVRFARRTEGAPRCALCGASIGADPEHRHLLDAAEERTLCACDACATLFSSDGRYRALPRDVRLLPGLGLTVADLQALGVPVRLACFVRDDERGTGGRAVYPSVAGAVTTRLDASAFALLESKSDVIATLSPRVEALLVRADPPRERAYLVPLDVCYRLIGLLRAGTGEAERTVERFFDELDARARRQGGA
jgi:hypothetical protein